MIVATKREASRIAFFGARKMDGEGYKISQVDFAGQDGAEIDTYVVRGPKSVNYVELPAEGITCTCPFFKDNEKHGVCKHTMRVSWMIADAKRDAAELAAIDAEAEEWAHRHEAHATGPHVTGLPL
jgi:hypothetical protein